MSERKVLVCGRRGPHFDAILREMASLLIKRPAGCRLLKGPFALPPTVALAKVISSWGARLTWTAQREHAAQIVKAVENHKQGANVFMSSDAILSSLPLPFLGVHMTRPQYSAAIFSNTSIGGQGFDRAGFDMAGGVIGSRGLGAPLCIYSLVFEQFPFPFSVFLYLIKLT